LLIPWLALTFKTLQLGFDAQNVVALRMLRFATGDARAQNEARRVVAEKIEAAAEVQSAAISAIRTGRKDATSWTIPCPRETNRWFVIGKVRAALLSS
jgi:hypothetical protein